MRALFHLGVACLVTVTLSHGAEAQPCGDPEFCPPAEGCWDELTGEDTCVAPPGACVPPAEPTFTFLDDQDGSDDGQLVALGNAEPTESCGTLLVDTTGYWSIFDMELSESCSQQLDETGYLTISNSCNPDGWALERNMGERYLVIDMDNTAACTDSSECAAGTVCRDGTNGGQCCVPEDPVFMGTFLLVADEPNVICLHHWCPEYRELVAAGEDPGFNFSDCTGINSVHFRVGSTSLACEENELLLPCRWGCVTGECLPDPCIAANCPDYCKDGVCLATNPCAVMSCEFGCVNGYCLQSPDSRGPDVDGDGYNAWGDCDDQDAARNPGMPEVCDNGLDDDCDGFKDEEPCLDAGALDGGSAVGSDDGGGSGAVGTGTQGSCSCRAVGGAASPGSLALLALLLLRRRRRS